MFLRTKLHFQIWEFEFEFEEEFENLNFQIENQILHFTSCARKIGHFFTETTDIYIQTPAIFAIYLSKLSGQMFRHAMSLQ